MIRLLPGLILVTSLAIASQSLRAEDTAPADTLAPLVELLRISDDPQFQRDILKGMNDALKGRAGVKMPPGWSDVAAQLSRSSDQEVRALTQSLSTLFGDAASIDRLRQMVADRAADADARRRALQSLLDAKTPELAPLLQSLLDDPALRGHALKGLGGYDHAGSAAAILRSYPTLTAPEKIDALSTLASRDSWAAELLKALESQAIPRSDLNAAVVRQLTTLGNEQLDAWIREHWGSLRSTSDEKLQEIARYKQLVASARPEQLDPSRGRAVFARTCLQCHMLFGEGGKVGPDLTGSGRADLDYILTNMIDPNAVIGKDYEVSIVRTRDKRMIVGIIAQEDEKTITVLDQVETHILPRSQIERIRPSDTSMMPEGLLQGLTDQEALDLIAYLRSPDQVPMPPDAETGQ